MVFKSLKYFIIGGLFMLVGWVMAASSVGFVLKSEAAELSVVRLDLRIGSEGNRTYRPSFELVTDQSPRPTYTGGPWMSLAPHQTGDQVSGRYQPESGRMKSDLMLGRTILMGSFLWLIGFFTFVQGILVAKGVNEGLMPLRVTSRKSQNQRRIRTVRRLLRD